MRKADGYYIPIQRRSSEVADARGLLATFPRGSHALGVGNAGEENVYWSVFRELAEEGYNLEDAQGNPNFVTKDWFFSQANCPGMRWFLDNPDSYICEVVAFGFDAILGDFHFAVLLAIKDPSYYDQFSGKLRKNWETDSFIEVSTTDTRQISKLLKDPTWVGDALFHFVEALLRLQQLDPKYVSLPKIERHVEMDPIPGPSR